jgi:hypothetical protein
MAYEMNRDLRHPAGRERRADPAEPQPRVRISWCAVSRAARRIVFLGRDNQKHRAIAMRAASFRVEARVSGNNACSWLDRRHHLHEFVADPQLRVIDHENFDRSPLRPQPQPQLCLDSLKLKLPCNPV